MRSFEPSISELNGKRVERFRRIGKRIAIGFEGEYWLVMHLMIAGRLHWFDAGAKRSGRAVLAAFTFDRGVLTLTEAGTKRRASIHVVKGESALAQHDPRGLEVLESSYEVFRERLLAGNHTLKRALTDPRSFSGIGNAYSDEILHRAKLSPVTLTSRLDEEALQRLHSAIREVLEEWIGRLREQAHGEFPEKVTAFHEGMAVHGRYGKACPACGTEVQRIRYADNETNYCPRCQTGGRLLADRALSRLLKSGWPRSIEELELGK